MNRACTSMMVSILCALSLTACATGSVLDGDIDDVDSDEDVSPSGGDAEGSEDSAGTDEQDPVDAPSDDSSGVDTPSDNSSGNVNPMSEAAACEALVEVQEAMINKLKCSMTTRICPTLIRQMTGKICVEYDESSVLVCIERYRAAPTCQSLEDVINTCVVDHIPDTKSPDCN